MRADDRRSDRRFLFFFLLLGGVQLLAIALTPYSLAPDEAHYWDWSSRVDWSYYSKGPLIALLIKGGTLLFGDSAFAVRFPSWACYTVFQLAMFLFLRRVYGARIALCAWLACRSMLIFEQSGTVATTDAAALCLWLLAIIAAYAALVEERRWSWAIFGLCVGLGALAKYTVLILFPAIVAFLVVSSQSRNHLRSSFLWLGAGLTALCLVPILWWNSAHGWVNIAHNAGHVVKKGGAFLHPNYFLELVGGQLGLVGPVTLVCLLIVWPAGYRAWRQGDLSSGLFWSSTVPFAIFVVLLSWTKRVYANWPMPAYVGALCLFVQLYSQSLIPNERFKRLYGWCIGTGFSIVVIAYAVFLGMTFGVPMKFLPVKKLAGWDTAGARAGEALRVCTRGNAGFMLVTDYEVGAELAFYTRPKPEVLCDNIDGRRMNQYDIWGGWEAQTGRPGLIVLKEPAELSAVAGRFKAVRELSELRTEIQANGESLRTFHFYCGEDFNGRPPMPPTAR